MLGGGIGMEIKNRNRLIAITILLFMVAILVSYTYGKHIVERQYELKEVIVCELPEDIWAYNWNVSIYNWNISIVNRTCMWIREYEEESE